MRLLPLALTLLQTAAPAVSIDAVYFAQTHVQKPSDAYFGLVSSRDALIKAHVVDPELVIPPRSGVPAARIRSQSDYLIQTDDQHAVVHTRGGAMMMTSRLVPCRKNASHFRTRADKPPALPG